MSYSREKTIDDKNKLLHSLKGYLSSLNDEECFFHYSPHLSFVHENLVILLVQRKTGVSLQIHVTIDYNCRGAVEHFTLREDPSLARVSSDLAEVAVTGIILQGLNILFFLASYQQLNRLPFYLWYEEALDIAGVGEGFLKDKTLVGNYVNYKLPTTPRDYASFIDATKKILVQLQNKVWCLGKSNDDVWSFLQTKRFFKENQQETHLIPSQSANSNSGLIIAFSKTMTINKNE